MNTSFLLLASGKYKLYAQHAPLSLLSVPIWKRITCDTLPLEMWYTFWGFQFLFVPFFSIIFFYHLSNIGHKEEVSDLPILSTVFRLTWCQLKEIYPQSYFLASIFSKTSVTNGSIFLDIFRTDNHPFFYIKIKLMRKERERWKLEIHTVSR